jgi:hypothetical protein
VGATIIIPDLYIGTTSDTDGKFVMAIRSSATAFQYVRSTATLYDGEAGINIHPHSFQVADAYFLKV